jgi:phospholipid transport system substrate-binding protein
LAPLCFGCVVATAGVAAHADQQADARAVVERVYDAAVAIAQSADPASSQSRTLRNAFDGSAIARVVLGDHWSTTGSADRNDFVDALLDAIVQGLAKRLGRQSARDFAITATRTLANGDILVRSLANRTATDPVTVDWRIHRCNTALCIVDVLVSGASIALQRRDDVAARLTVPGSSIAKITADLRKGGGPL